MKQLGPAFFAADAMVVAPALIGMHLVLGAHHVQIIETEAYTADDPASHSFRGPTTRNAPMFAAPGRLYVYLIYGIHHCLNVVTGAEGDGQAVLLRAGLIHGVDPRRSSGPGRLAALVGADRTWNGVEVQGWAPARPLAGVVEVTARIGISRAVDWPRRWVLRP